jgi:hypothetical protein
MQERRLTTLKTFCDVTDTRGLLRDYKNPLEKGWGERAAVVDIDFLNKAGKTPSAKLATDAIHALSLLRNRKKATDLLSLCIDEMGLGSISQVSHVCIYLEVLVKFEIMAAMGAIPKQPDNFLIPLSITKDSNNFLANQLKERSYIVNEETLDKCYVYNLRPAIIENRTLLNLNSLNILNGDEIMHRRAEKLTTPIAELVNQTYPPVLEQIITYAWVKELGKSNIQKIEKGPN